MASSPGPNLYQPTSSTLGGTAKSPVAVHPDRVDRRRRRRSPGCAAGPAARRATSADGAGRRHRRRPRTARRGRQRGHRRPRQRWARAATGRPPRAAAISAATPAARATERAAPTNGHLVRARRSRTAHRRGAAAAHRPRRARTTRSTGRWPPGRRCRSARHPGPSAGPSMVCVTSAERLVLRRTDRVHDRRRALLEVQVRRAEHHGRSCRPGRRRADTVPASMSAFASLGLVRSLKTGVPPARTSTAGAAAVCRTISRALPAAACLHVVDERRDRRLPVRVEVGDEADVGAARDRGVVDLEDRAADRLARLGEREVVRALRQVERPGDGAGLEVVEGLRRR